MPLCDLARRSHWRAEFLGDPVVDVVFFVDYAIADAPKNWTAARNGHFC